MEVLTATERRESSRTQDPRVFVFVGEAGSGKSELALNKAFSLAAAGRCVRFFDLDQTKPLFRSRELATRMTSNGIQFDQDSQFLDARTMPAGVMARLNDASLNVVVDVGGDAQGAIVLGQCASAWTSEVEASFVINPYRAFSGTSVEIEATLASIESVARLLALGIIANPNFGGQTTFEDVLGGIDLVEANVSAIDRKIRKVTALRQFLDRIVAERTEYVVEGIDRYIVAPWELR